MNRYREVAEWINAPTHSGVKPCKTMTECAIHTIALPPFGAFAAIVLSGPDEKFGTIAVLDREEVEAHILLLRNAMDDADRLEAGQAPRHATPSLRRN